MRYPALAVMILSAAALRGAVGPQSVTLNPTRTSAVIATAFTILGTEAEIACTSADDCRGRYELEYRGTGVAPQLPRVTTVEKVGRYSFRVSFDTALAEIQDIWLIAPRLPIDGPKKVDRGEFRLTANLAMHPRCKDTLIYAATSEMVAPTPSNVTVTLLDLEKEQFIPVGVEWITPYGNLPNYCRPATGAQAEQPAYTFLIKLKPPTSLHGDMVLGNILFPAIPRGKTMSAKVVGFEPGVTLSGKLVTPKYPATKDAATYYFLGQRVFADVGADQYAFDVKLAPVIAAKKFDFIPNVSLNAGSDAAKLPDTGSASAAFVFWLSSGRRSLGNVTVAPTFRTDKGYDNRDAGVDLTFAPSIARLYQPVERRRLKNPKTDFGWWVTVDGGVEWGEHIASKAAEVEGTDFARVRGAVAYNAQWRDIGFSTAYQHRILGDDEVITDADTILRIDDSSRGYVRAELSYNFGPAAITLVHINGKLPPAFKEAHSTTLGFAMKY